MKNGILAVLLGLLSYQCSTPNTRQTVEASCGQCQFGLKTQKGCDLAIRFEGKAYFVKGVHIDDFGDAHDPDKGFCNSIRTATVRGNLKERIFEVTDFELKE